MSFEVVKLWSDHLLIKAVTAPEDGSLTAAINDGIVQLREVPDQPNMWRLDFDFLSTRVHTFAVRVASGRRLAELKGWSEALFRHDVESIHRKIQMRGLPIAGGFRYVGSIQGYLWCRDHADQLSRADFIRLASYCLCCSIYRLMERSSAQNLRDVQVTVDRIQALISTFDFVNLSPDEARWFPSLSFAVAQLFLCYDRAEECVELLIAGLKEIDRCLELAPITAYNLALSNCLLCALLVSRKDARFEFHATHWEQIFRLYPARMDIRLGTMIEFKDIYMALLLNHRIYNQFLVTGYRDKRFTKVTATEIIDTCIRAEPPPVVRRRIAEGSLSAFGGGQD